MCESLSEITCCEFWISMVPAREQSGRTPPNFHSHPSTSASSQVFNVAKVHVVLIQILLSPRITLKSWEPSHRNRQRQLSQNQTALLGQILITSAPLRRAFKSSQHGTQKRQPVDHIISRSWASFDHLDSCPDFRLNLRDLDTYRSTATESQSSADTQHEFKQATVTYFT